MIKLYKRDIQNVTYQKKRGLLYQKKNVKRLTVRNALVVKKASSLCLTRMLLRKQVRQHVQLNGIKTSNQNQLHFLCGQSSPFHLTQKSAPKGVGVDRLLTLA